MPTGSKSRRAVNSRQGRSIVWGVAEVERLHARLQSLSGGAAPAGALGTAAKSLPAGASAASVLPARSLPVAAPATGASPAGALSAGVSRAGTLPAGTSPAAAPSVVASPAAASSAGAQLLSAYQELKVQTLAVMPALFSVMSRADFEIRAIRPLGRDNDIAALPGSDLPGGLAGRRGSGRPLCGHCSRQGPARARGHRGLSSGGDAGASLPIRASAGAGRFTEIPPVRRRAGLRRWLGSVCGIPGEELGCTATKRPDAMRFSCN